VNGAGRRKLEIYTNLRQAPARPKPRNPIPTGPPPEKYRVRHKENTTVPLRVYNSLTRRKEPFDMEPGSTVKFFVCGPTVYDYAHLGHARTYVAFDIIARYLEFLGYHVRYLMNITDVADRLIERAAQSKKEPLPLAREYEHAFLENMKALGITNVEGYYRASDYIPQITAQIRGLIEKGMAYQTETGVYFEVNKYPKFGQLSGLNRDELGLRRLELCSSKKNTEDFSLWRRHNAGLRWESPWGDGRPGWHVEDTAISITNFGDTYDMHGGASELIFPHHEAEIAQAEALTGKAPFVKFWLHTGLLTMKGRKMSKSLGNVIPIREALSQYTAEELRYYFASFHYRDQVNVSDSALKRARKDLRYIRKNLQIFQNSHSAPRKAIKTSVMVQRAESDFRNCMDDDFDTPKALAVLRNFSEKLSRLDKVGIDDRSKMIAGQAFRRMSNIVGILSWYKKELI
jgi:cysteinyl-tRNA synthetase